MFEISMYKVERKVRLLITKVEPDGSLEKWQESFLII